MAVNKYQPHVLVLVEDNAYRQISNGFLLHAFLNERLIQVLPECGGWSKVRDRFQQHYIGYLTTYSEGRLLMVIDFDGDLARSAQMLEVVPNDLKDRVFLLGAKDEAEDLKNSGQHQFEDIGATLADECHQNARVMWANPQLAHNVAQLNKMADLVRDVLFS